MFSKALLFLAMVLAIAAPAASAHQAGNIPDPPLTAWASAHGLTGNGSIRLMLFARSATDMPVPGVKVYLKVRISKNVKFSYASARALGPNETIKASADGKLLTWSMYSAPPNTGGPARLPIMFTIPELKSGQHFSVEVWGTTVEGTMPTASTILIWGTA